jgi:cell division protein FtsQ
MKSKGTGERMGRIKRKRQRTIRLVSLAVLVLALVIASLLFRVRTIVVNGNTRHSDSAIASDLSYDFLTGNTLYLMWKYRNGSVPENMPYLSSMEIQMDSPSKITVTVSEKELVGYVDEGQKVYFDQDGIVLEITDEVFSDIPEVTGASIGEVVLYQKLPTDSSAQLRTILSLVQLMKYQGLTAKEISFGDSMDMTVTIGEVHAMLGQDEYLEEKVANLRAIMDSLDGKSGTLHMENFTGKNESVTFSAGEETEEESGADEAISEEDGDDRSGTSVPDEDVLSGTGTDEDTSDGSGSGDDTDTLSGSDSTAGSDSDDGTGQDAEADDDSQDTQTSTKFMVFNSSGQLVYNAQVVNGVVVDSYGNPIDGCSVNEDGNVVDAYWNVIDPATGELAQ